MTFELLIATTNPGKLREFRQLLGDLPGLSLLAPADVGGIPNVIEDGDSFEHNASKKAREVAAAACRAVLSDDSGLEVDALGGRPGVHSARYAGSSASDADNNRKLIAELAAVPPERRGARYRVVLAFTDPSAPHIGSELRVHTVSASCEGRIRLEPRGHGGFGYDPYFQPEGYDCSMAELSAEQKNRISHRARAAVELRRFLADYLARDGAHLGRAGSDSSL